MGSDENLFRKRLVKSKSGLRIVLVNEKYNSPFLLGEPNWIPDSEISQCTGCKRRFNFTTRKHHCRRCGKIYCSLCCCSRISLPRMSFVDPVRVCNNCILVSEEEKDFFENKLKTLTNGATFILNFVDSDSNDLCLCKLSSDHQRLLFDSLNKFPSLPLDSVTTFSVVHDIDTGVKSMEIMFDNGRIKLSTGTETSKTLAMEWIEALHHAFKLIDVNLSA